MLIFNTIDNDYQLYFFEEDIQMNGNWLVYTWQFTENNRP